MGTRDFWLLCGEDCAGGIALLTLPIVRVVLCLLVIGSVVSFVWQKPLKGGRWKRYYALLFTQLSFTP